jgi:biopolymer transport protein ExbD
MAMLIDSGQDDDGLLTTINTTPLVDVMLVLLIIFLITIPAVTSSINVQLPHESLEPHEIKAESLVLTIDSQARVYMDGELISSQELNQKMKLIALEQPQREVQIIGDAMTEFEPIGRVLSIAKNAGLNKINFLTEPQGTTSR